MKDKIMEQLRAERLKHLTEVMKVSNPKEWAKSETNFMWVRRAIKLTLNNVNDAIDDLTKEWLCERECLECDYVKDFVKQLGQKLSEEK